VPQPPEGRGLEWLSSGFSPRPQVSRAGVARVAQYTARFGRRGHGRRPAPQDWAGYGTFRAPLERPSKPLGSSYR